MKWLPISLGLALCWPGALRAADWPQWRGPRRDGAWTETGLLEVFPADGLRISWRVPVGPGWSSPIVARGRVYVTDVQLARPSAHERVQCFEEKTGRQLWSRAYAVNYPAWAFDPTAGGPRSTPIAHDGRVFTLGNLGHLFCLDAISGQTVWQKDLARDYQVKEFTGITGSPLIEGQLLILNICGQPGACVVALETHSGREAWRSLGDSCTYSSPIVLTAGGRRQLIVWTQEAVTSLDPATGQIWWRQPLRTPGEQAVSTPVCADYCLLVAGLMFQLAADKPAATVLWPDPRALSPRVLSNTSTALLQSGYVYSAKTSGELVCLEAATGKPVWQTNRVTDLMTGSSIHLTPCGKAVFLFTDRGELIRAQLTPQGYREICRARLIEPTTPYGKRKCAWASPAFANGHVFARSDAELVSASLQSR